MKTYQFVYSDGGHSVDFLIYHNLPDVHGLNIETACINWFYRTKGYTIWSLCNYINDKETGYVAAASEEDFKALTL